MSLRVLGELLCDFLLWVPPWPRVLSSGQNTFSERLPQFGAGLSGLRGGLSYGDPGPMRQNSLFCLIVE